ncbi:transcriptional regulator with XRE-family HTH domain [Actinopolyspora lacussalsi]|uniref:Helix-turn-helix domain-containing protein n=1 Tax=Actinopolyspora mzabensis TaxID=995066 RepID=A0A1G8W305_ACTMZ|nr:helix-turn-helix transcriptional regulator [Actinopolyspora mzabensis]MDP9642073.1 transcriptional regulator with XRE-family HTH domain [Actinopolyspora lacussalsi]SDJ72751.1 Helix-turn-helix domain-containing protein [Actinopolyspora mzabensis]
MGGNSRGLPKTRTLGAELREAREKAGLSTRKLAEKVHKHHSVLARYESGAKRPEPETVAAILTALDATDTERSRVVELARAAEDANWVAVGDSSHRDMTTLIEYERTASTIAEVATTVIPGVLQTHDYARAIIATWSPGDADTRTAIRLGRRDMLTKRDAPNFTAIITENALRDPIGGTEVHTEQLRHLLKMSELPNVEIRIVASRTGQWNPTHAGSFIYFDFDKAAPIVYIEHFSSLTLLHTPKEIHAFENALTTLRNTAMNPEQSTDLIATLANTQGAPSDS